MSHRLPATWEAVCTVEAITPDEALAGRTIKVQFALQASLDYVLAWAECTPFWWGHGRGQFSIMLDYKGRHPLLSLWFVDLVGRYHPYKNNRTHYLGVMGILTLVPFAENGVEVRAEWHGRGMREQFNQVLRALRARWREWPAADAVEGDASAIASQVPAQNMRPWEQVPDVGHNRKMLELWHAGDTGRQIGNRIGRTQKTVQNDISRLRKAFGEQIVPYRRRKA
jgi:hypothetical protein